MESTLDRFLPEYRHNEIHETVISAPLEAARRAVREVKAREVALARLLFGIRMLPGRLLGRRGSSASIGRWSNREAR